MQLPIEKSDNVVYPYCFGADSFQEIFLPGHRREIEKSSIPSSARVTGLETYARVDVSDPFPCYCMSGEIWGKMQ